MRTLIFAISFLLGAIAILWIGIGFRHTDLLALTVTAIIGLVYAIGFLEQWRFRRATGGLQQALRQPPQGDLGGWLTQLHPSLQQPVRRRIEGDAFALPGPVLTPYLVGLLVMLGLLGTFIGMVITLQGAVSALQGSSELSAIRDGLAAPIAGLSLAFGTSVAGICASAMLGLASTLSRRDRLLCTQNLDALTASALHHYSRQHQRQQAYQALHSQSQALPALVDKLQRVSEQLAQMSEHLGGTLTNNQNAFHDSLNQQYQLLAESVGNTLKDSLRESSRQAAEGIRPVMEEALAALSSQVRETHQQFQHSTGQQLSQIAEQFQHCTEQAAHHWQQGLNKQQQAGSALLERIGDTLSAHTDHYRQGGEALLQAQQQGQQQLQEQLHNQLGALRDQEASHADAAQQRLAALEATVADHLGQLGQALEAPLQRLLDSAAETPKAAAQVISQLREEISKNIQRDNQLLEERQQLMSQLDGLLHSQRDATQAQQQAIDTLIQESAQVLQGIGEQFSTRLHNHSEQLGQVISEVAGSANEVASLSDAFALAVQQYSSSNDGLVAHLQQLEQALQHNSNRSDEQLAYYVEQAREIIDLSLSAQQDVLDTLGQLRNGTTGQAALHATAEAR